MNYQKIYSAFIADRRARESALTGYAESHHILPRAKGGGDEVSNLIRLTPEDHFFAHLLLAKIHGGKMWLALMIMSRRPKGRDRSEGFLRRTRKLYGMAKRNALPEYAADMARRIADGTGPMDTPEARAKVSAAMKGRTFSPEVRAKISAAKKGVARSPESVAKQSATLTGAKRPPEFGAAISAALKGKKKSAAHVEKMRASATGKVASDETRAKKRAACLAKDDPAFFRGRQHSAEIKARMGAVYEAKREYARRFGVSPKIITLGMVREAGIPVNVCL